MGRRKQLRLWAEEQNMGGDPIGCVNLEWRPEHASPFELERPILEEAERWLLGVYVRGETREIPTKRHTLESNRNQLTLQFPSHE